MEENFIKIYHWLYPLSWLYGIGVCLRNKLFDWGWLRSKSFDVPVICVGNLAVGGTGKTPHTEYLIKLLQKNGVKVATLSRGYKRKSRGYVLADDKSNVRQIGDEPYQIKNKFPNARVAVDENRCHGIEQLLKLENPTVEAIILDDAFQHIKPIDFNIIAKRLHLYPYQQLYFSRFRYGMLTPLFPEKTNSRKVLSSLTRDEQVLLVTGIASPAPLQKEVESYTPHVKLLSFDDHHDFTPKDLLQIKEQFLHLEEWKRLIITTEKDAARLKLHPALDETLKPYIYVLPIEIEILQNQQYIFNQNIIGYVRAHSRNSSLSEGKDAHPA